MTSVSCRGLVNLPDALSGQRDAVMPCFKVDDHAIAACDFYTRGHQESFIRNGARDFKRPGTIVRGG